MVKNVSAMQENWVWALGQEDPLEKGMATHSSILAWRIPCTEGLLSYTPWVTKSPTRDRWYYKSYSLFCCCFSHILFLRSLYGALWASSQFFSPMECVYHILVREWSCSVVSESLQPHRLWSTRLLHPCNFPGKNTGVGCHFLLLLHII